MTKVLVSICCLGIIIFSTVGHFAYLQYFSIPSLEKVVLQAQKNLQDVKIFHSEMLFGVKGWKEATEPAAEKKESNVSVTLYRPFSLLGASLKDNLTQKPSFCNDHPEENICKEESAYTFLVEMESDFDMRKEKAVEMSSNIFLEGSSQNFNFSGDISLVNLSEENLFFKLNNLSYDFTGIEEDSQQLIDFYEEIIIRPLKGKWMLFNLEETIKGYSDLDYLAPEEETLPSFTDEEMAKIAEFVYQSFEVKSSKRVEFDGEKAYYYKFEVNKEKLKNSLSEILNFLTKTYQETGYFSEEVIDQQELNATIEESLEYLTLIEGEVWCRTIDFLPLKINFSVQMEGFEEQEEFLVWGEAVFSKFNEEVFIEEPKGAAPFTEVFEDIMINLESWPPEQQTKIPDEFEEEAPESEKEGNTDTDGDGLTDLEEICLGTNFDHLDTDKDGYSDFEEIQNGYNPLKQSPGDKFTQDEKSRADACLIGD